ncbi:MAG: ribonuclease HII [Dehalococcoidia bacterium]|nr:ribonuclease HII [Dehalococcoidia bacterium]
MSAIDLRGGVDEVGRGPLAGPVVAAAVIFERGVRLEGVRDSKKVPARQRQELSDLIRRMALSWAIGAATVAEVDQYNIHHATLLAMRRAVYGLNVTPTYLYVDGTAYPDVGCPGKAMVRADQNIHVVAAASILAKVARDRVMVAMSKEYPGYGFEMHKGYPTPSHLDTLGRLGPCAIHRTSYRPVRKLLEGRD